MISKYNNPIWIILLLVSYLGFSYYLFGAWWHSSVGTVLMVLFSYLIWKDQFLRVTGLYLNLKKIIFSLLLAAGAFAGSWIIAGYIGSNQGFTVQISGFRSYYHDVFYTMNEEIILGGIPVYLLVTRWKLRPVYVSLGIALFFAIIHFVFYRWIFIQKGILEFQTLTTLFFVGILRNNLIIINRHIGYSWAIHFAWMAIMFGSHLYRPGADEGLTEPERFNALLGSAEMLVISLLLAGASTWFMIRKDRKFDIS